MLNVSYFFRLLFLFASSERCTTLSLGSSPLPSGRARLHLHSFLARCGGADATMPRAAVGVGGVARWRRWACCAHARSAARTACGVETKLVFPLFLLRCSVHLHTWTRNFNSSFLFADSQKGMKMFRYRVPSLNATDVVECEALRLDPIKSTRQMDNLAPELHTGEGTHSWTKTRVVGVCPRCVRRDPRSKTGLDSSLSVGKKNRRRRLLQHEVRLNTPP